MKITKLTILLILATQSSSVFADSGAIVELKNTQALDYSYKNNADDATILDTTFNDDWIKTTPQYLKVQDKSFNISKENNFSTGKKLAFAWDLSSYLSLNVSVFENRAQFANNDAANPLSAFSYSGFNKMISAQAQPSLNNINRNLKGYTFGLSSEVNLWQNYKLDINFDYGLLDGADLVGFSNSEINTTSFALGIRKAKFGASVNTDVFIQDNVDLVDSSRLGFEIDWHFTDDSKISIGTKQRLNDSTQSSNNPNSLDSITGNVQYIKFEHNL